MQARFVKLLEKCKNDHFVISFIKYGIKKVEEFQVIPAAVCGMQGKITKREKVV